MRLIDADAWFGQLNKITVTDDMYGASVAEGVAKAMALILNAPTIDAVPVVRCGECERRDKNFISEDGNICCPYMEAFMPKDGFCSYGERKDGYDGLF